MIRECVRHLLHILLDACPHPLQLEHRLAIDVPRVGLRRVVIQLEQILQFIDLQQ